ncbi:glucans biosynthesis protein [Lutimaribacter saemankumensis]|uniref:Glucans biosynthesis protein n=1 Tax=Lutimaribacter saemankumensis TaxID=490829 RepID=A0A1G8RCM3_9RHOB|nr:glucans biosynthesis protein [Lutimaribacter saemankumensis]
MAPRCRAKSKRSGQRCKAPAVFGWAVCRMHGARGGHGSGKKNPAYKHGLRSQELVEMRKAINELVREGKEVEGLIS